MNDFTSIFVYSSTHHNLIMQTETEIYRLSFD